MRVIVNGEERIAAGGTTVRALLDTLAVNRTAVVVEHNGLVAERDRLDQIVLEDGDRLEIVRFVGGG